jgi:hypothetical protein
MAEGLFVVLFLIIWVAMLAVATGGLVLWIMALIEVVRYPDQVYRAAGTEKTTWVLVVVLVGSIGALIYWFGPRKRLKAAEPYAYAWGYGMPPGQPYPPGSYGTPPYPDPNAGHAAPGQPNPPPPYGQGPPPPPAG